jgi:hypothetical protein
MFGVAIAAVALRVALLSHCVGVVAAIIMLHGVSGALSLCHVGVATAIIAPHGCCSCHRHTAWGVAGAVVALYSSCPHHMLLLSLPSIAVATVALCMVSGALSSCCMGVAAAIVTLCGVS